MKQLGQKSNHKKTNHVQKKIERMREILFPQSHTPLSVYKVDYHFHPNLPNEEAAALNKCKNWWQELQCFRRSYTSHRPQSDIVPVPVCHNGARSLRNRTYRPLNFRLSFMVPRGRDIHSTSSPSSPYLRVCGFQFSPINVKVSHLVWIVLQFCLLNPHGQPLFRLRFGSQQENEIVMPMCLCDAEEVFISLHRLTHIHTTVSIDMVKRRPSSI